MTEASSADVPVTVTVTGTPIYQKGVSTVSYPPIVDDPATVSATTVVRRLRAAGVMTIRLRERRRPEMLALVVFRVGEERNGDRSAVLVFDTDHWAGGPNVPGAYFDYLGDRWTPTEDVVRSVAAMLGTHAR